METQSDETRNKKDEPNNTIVLTTENVTNETNEEITKMDPLQTAGGISSSNKETHEMDVNDSESSSSSDDDKSENKDKNKDKNENENEEEQNQEQQHDESEQIEDENEDRSDEKEIMLKEKTTKDILLDRVLNKVQKTSKSKFSENMEKTQR